MYLILNKLNKTILRTLYFQLLYHTEHRTIEALNS